MLEPRRHDRRTVLQRQQHHMHKVVDRIILKSLANLSKQKNTDLLLLQPLAMQREETDEKGLRVSQR